jgi:3-isopropylmalate/(R)-2-methylmalate dehydratase small subunit
MGSDRAVKAVTGRGVPVPGADVDTDRIIPARFMKAVSFEGLGEHSFHDVRFDEKGEPLDHPLNDPRYRGASILVVGRNFGCGSSREHAPQALMRFGIRAIVGESFAEIFAGNCTAIGVPAVRVSAEAAALLARLVEKRPGTELVVDLERKVVKADGKEHPLEIPESFWRALVDGTWDTTALLLANRVEIDRTSAKLPYLTGFAGGRG